MKFTVEIRCENDAFQSDPRPELARILTKLRDRVIDSRIPDGDLTDINGNRVGYFKLAGEPETFRVLVRGMKHLTQTVEVQATSRNEALDLALDQATKRDFVWDESDPEDIQTEGFE